MALASAGGLVVGAFAVLLAALPLISTPAAAVDAGKFRTCEQGSFCRRYRGLIKQVEASGGAQFAHAIAEGSSTASGNVFSAKVEHVNDPSVQPLSLELRWFRDAAEGRCGIVRLFVSEKAPLHPRFQLRPGDVVLDEAEFSPDAITMSASEGSTKLTSSAPGACEVVIRHRPFELDFHAGGRLLQRLNGRHLFNFESYRAQGTKHAGFVDATDVEDRDLWQEGFAGHTDTKPRGPAAVGIDVAFESAQDVFGLAEHATNLGLGANRLQEPYRLYNLDVFEYAMDVPMALYGAIPLVTAVHHWGDGQASASGFFFVNPSEGFVKVDQVSSGMFGGGGAGGVNSWWLFESGVLDAFLLAGPTPHAVLQQYHTVTGMPRLPPISTLGKHQSRWNYVDVEDSVSVNRKFDQNDIPYDVLWLDIEHTDGKKYFTWHPTHFAQPNVLLDALNASKRKLVTIVDPHIKREEGYGVFTTLREKDFFTKTSSGSQYDGWCWPGTSFYPDFCNPAMRDQWAKFFALDYYPHNRPDLYTWNDMNEPSVFNGPEVTMPRDNLHKCHTESYGVEHRDVHNVYGFYHHGATVQGQLERAPHIRPFVLTRSFFAGSHRHGAIWTGDNMARWEHLQKSIPMLVTLALCGTSFVGADVPGFFYDPDLELFERWHQLGIWYPFYRGHAHLETKRREPWMFGEAVTSMVRQQVTVRYQMMPTWYTLFAEWALGGLPIVRPLWYHDIGEKEAFRHQDESFLLGEHILVRGVTKARMTTADVYLPRAGSTWFDFWNPQAPTLPGGKVTTVTLEKAHVPVFVRSGTILFKRMRRRRSTGAMVADPYTIVVYGEAAKGRLYVDDGESHAYQDGSFLYDEFDFDGASLRELPAPAGIWGRGEGARALRGPEAKGLPDLPRRRLTVERITFVGLSRKPSGARLTHGASSGQAADELSVTVENGAAGSFVATVKKPTGILGDRWSLELHF